MAHTKYTNRDGTPDMRFKVNKQSRLRCMDQARQKALGIAEKAIKEAEKAPTKVEPVTCCICMDETATQKGHAKLNCGHTYCVACFTQHARLSDKCPLCRTSFAPEPTKVREVIPAFVIADQVQDQLDQMLPSEADAEDVFGFLAVTPSVAYDRLRSLLRNECLSAAISVANWYEPSSDYGFRNTNEEDIIDAADEQDEQDVQAQFQAQEALEQAAGNIAAAAAGNMESVDMEIDPNPPPGFPPRQLFPDESELADRRDRVLASDDLNQGISSLAQAAARATQLVGNAYPDLTSSDSVQGNPAEPDFIPFEPVEFDAMAALAAHDDALPRSSPPEDGEIIEDDSLVRYFNQAASEAESELAEAMSEAAAAAPTPPRQQTSEHNASARWWLQRHAEELESENARLRDNTQVRTSEQGLGESEDDWRPWRRARAARRQQAQEDAEIASERAAARSGGEDSFTTPIRRRGAGDGITYDPDVYFNDD
jgi:hypothetical protein